MFRPKLRLFKGTCFGFSLFRFWPVSVDHYVQGVNRRQVATFHSLYCPCLPTCQKVNVNMLVNKIFSWMNWYGLVIPLQYVLLLSLPPLAEVLLSSAHSPFQIFPPFAMWYPECMDLNHLTSDPSHRKRLKIISYITEEFYTATLSLCSKAVTAQCMHCVALKILEILASAHALAHLWLATVVQTGT